MRWSPAQALDLLAGLEALGLPDRIFRKLHPQQHRMEVYRNYCTGKLRFNARSASHDLCDRLDSVLHLARDRSQARLPEEADWDRLIAEALAFAPSGRHQPANLYRRLQEEHLLVIAQQIVSLLPIARDLRSAMHRVARWQLRNLLWRWTVDAVRGDGVVEVDAARRAAIWPITRLAKDLPFRERRHEHVVPRAVIVNLLLESEMADARDVYDTISRYCLAAVVSRGESALLDRGPLRSTMPDGWQWGDDEWARYRATTAVDGNSTLFEQLEFPRDWATSSRGTSTLTSARMPQAGSDPVAGFEKWNRAFSDEARFSGEHVPDVERRIERLAVAWRAPLDPRWLRDVDEDAKWDEAGYRRGDKERPPRGEVAIEREILLNRASVDCLGETMVAGANAVPLCALGRKVEADLLLLTRGRAGFRQHVVEVKVSNENAWFAVVEHLRQLRLFEANRWWRGFFARRLPALGLRDDVRTGGIILAPASYFTDPGQKRNAVAPARRLIAALGVDVALATWSSGPVGMTIAQLAE